MLATEYGDPLLEESPIEGSPRAPPHKRGQDEDDLELLVEEHIAAPQAHARRLAPSLFCYEGGAHFQNQPGRTFAEIYELLDELGTGVSSTVYRVQDKQSSELRALKVIYSETFGESYDLETEDDTPFVAEMNVLRTVDHPHIIRLFDCFEGPGTRAIAMELCSGGNLFEHFSSLGSFGQETVAGVIRQIGGAVAHLHSMQICHCDLKPENILVVEASYSPELPGCPFIKLADFGVATIWPGKAAGVGASDYAAPEVLLDNRHCDETGDIWSLGMVAFVLLTGLEPKLVMDTILEHGLVPAIQGVSEVAVDAVSWCLDKTQEQRPTAPALLSHDWLVTVVPSSGPSGMEKVQARLQRFRRLSKLQQAMLQIVAYTMPVDQLAELSLTFEALDTDHDGKLSLEEVRYGLDQVGPDQKQHITTFQAIDFDKSEFVNYSEFVAACLTRKQCMQKDVLWRVFCAVDLDGSGTISQQNLELALQSTTMRNFFGDAWIARNFAEMDRDRNGQVDFEEFCTMMQEKMEGSPASTGIGPRRESFRVTPTNAGLGPRRHSFGGLSIGPRRESFISVASDGGAREVAASVSESQRAAEPPRS
mmetsp:Transcript_49502/g.115794  ORF Transcript_49502/g.115794 Transcript_49502/m.115794 type:complete len:592 (+) Transcript_49502:78-1853(+)